MVNVLVGIVIVLSIVLITTTVYLYNRYTKVVKNLKESNDLVETIQKNTKSTLDENKLLTGKCNNLLQQEEQHLNNIKILQDSNNKLREQLKKANEAYYDVQKECNDKIDKYKNRIATLNKKLDNKNISNEYTKTRRKNKS